MVLYNLGISLKDNDIIASGKKLARETLKRDKDIRFLISPTLCHGYSGIAIINKILGNYKVAEYYFNQIENSKNNNLKYYISDTQGNILSMSDNLKTLLSKVKFDNYRIVN